MNGAWQATHPTPTASAISYHSFHYKTDTALIPIILS